MTALAAPRIPATTWLVEPSSDVFVSPGPRLLAHLDDGPGLEAHERRHGPLPRVTLADLVALTRETAVRGRGGAGFPFGTKLETAARGRRPVVVVNASEGEPASAKDSVLCTTFPHRVLDGAVVAARALGASEVHVVVPSERPAVGAVLTRAIAERRAAGEKVRWHTHEAQPRFVAGQSRAVIELMSGREGLPVTAWSPEAVSGHKGRPTLLSNAETYAQVASLARLGSAAYAALGTSDDPGTTLLTLTTPWRRTVVEVEHGTPWEDVLSADDLDGPVLTGGYHGTWASAGALRGRTVGRAAMSDAGLSLGAGVVLTPGPGRCPVDLTVAIVDYLAGQSARRCGPCLNGLPALAEAVSEVAHGAGGGVGLTRVRRLAAMVERRGACAHPDGTVRLVRSLLTSEAAEMDRHQHGACSHLPTSMEEISP